MYLLKCLRVSEVNSSSRMTVFRVLLCFVFSRSPAHYQMLYFVLVTPEKQIYVISNAWAFLNLSLDLKWMHFTRLFVLIVRGDFSYVQLEYKQKLYKHPVSLLSQLDIHAQNCDQKMRLNRKWLSSEFKDLLYDPFKLFCYSLRAKPDSPFSLLYTCVVVLIGWLLIYTSIGQERIRRCTSTFWHYPVKLAFILITTDSLVLHHYRTGSPSYNYKLVGIWTYLRIPYPSISITVENWDFSEF